MKERTLNVAFTGFDIFAIIFLFASAVMALMRGLVREALTVTAMVTAALAALWTRPVFTPLARNLVGSALFSNILSVCMIFLLVYLTVSLVTAPLARAVKNDKRASVLDRAFGAVFGLTRGLVLLGFLVLVFKNTLPDAQPRWLTSARIYPLAASGAVLLQSLAPRSGWMTDTATTPENQPQNIADKDSIGRLIKHINEDENE